MNRSHSFAESTPAQTVNFSDIPPDIVQPVQVVRSQARAMAGTAPAANTQVLFSEVPPDVTQPVQIVATAQAMSAQLTPVPDLATTIAELRATGVADDEIRKFLKEIGSPHAFTLNAPHEGVKLTLPGGHLLTPIQSKLLLAAIATGLSTANPTMAPLIFSSLHALPAIANRFNVCIGIGPAIGGAVGGGISLGDGILFAPGDRVGFFGSIGGVLGATVGISATWQVTIVHGGPEVFGGTGSAITIGGGEYLVGSASALFNNAHEFIGVTFAMGVGYGTTPIEIYSQYQYTPASLGLRY